VRTPDALARAADLGLAMQLTNIARDIGEDARNGRCYVPLNWLAEAGVDPDAIATMETAPPAMQRITAHLLDAAQPLYASGLSGVACLPVSCRPAIRAAAGIYAAIGDAIVANGFDSIAQRAVVSGRRKLGLGLRAAGPFRFEPGLAQAPARSTTKFLVEAVSTAEGRAMARPGAQPAPGSWPWLLALCMELEARQRTQPGAMST
jgi:15-cis-phytoene synthase